MEYDVIIVGAGPAGCLCALNLASSNLRVALLDKSVFPRDKICGDALSGNVTFELNRLSKDLLNSFDRFSLKLGTKGVRFYAPNADSLDVALPNSKYGLKDPGFISKRLDFDHFLLNEVKKASTIELFEGCELKDIGKDADGLYVNTKKKRFRTKLVVGADGAHSRVAKSMGLYELDKKHHSAGLRIYYKGVKGFGEGQLIELHFYKEMLPGYLWVFPLPDGYANVGIGMLSDKVSKKKVNLQGLMERTLAEHPNLKQRFELASPVEKPKGFGLPLGSKKRKISAERVLLCGDAASLIDPFTGEGIGNAMTSGRIAAYHILEAFEKGDFSENFMKAYDRKIYRKMGAELRISHIMQKLLRFPRLFDFVVKKANNNEAVQELLVNMFNNVDIKKQLTKPSFYIRLLFK